MNVKPAVNSLWTVVAQWCHMASWNLGNIGNAFARVHQAITLTNIHLISFGMDPLGTDFHKFYFKY